MVINETGGVIEVKVKVSLDQREVAYVPCLCTSRRAATFGEIEWTIRSLVEVAKSGNTTRFATPESYIAVPDEKLDAQPYLESEIIRRFAAAAQCRFEWPNSLHELPRAVTR